MVLEKRLTGDRMPNSTLGHSGDGAAPSRRDDSFLSPETLMPLPTAETAVTAVRAPERFGEYEILGEIARGGMGVVYRARHRALGREVALKMILHGGADLTAVRRFEQEAKAAAALDHPGIVPLFDFGVHQGQPYFTMPLVPGGSLAAQVKKGGPPPVEETLRLMRGIIDAVGHAHQRGVVHRDLKPENVLIDAEGRPRITDFGLAKLRDGECANLTAPGQVLGTPAYVAPEQVGSGHPVGPAADVYALGGILYFLLTGKPPFFGPSVAAVLLSVVERPPAPPRQHSPSVPPDLEAVCLRCLEKDPARRYRSAEEMGRALGFGLSGLSGTRSMSGASADPDSRPSRAGKGVLIALASLACLAGAAVGAFFWFDRQDAEPQQQAPAGSEEPKQIASAEAKPEKKADRAALQWLEEMEKKGHDGRALEVELIGSEAGKDGVHRLHPGQTLRLRVKSEVAGYVGVWSVSPDGDMTQLFPTVKGKESNRLEAGKPRMIPEKEGDAITAEADGRRERLLVLRSSQPWDVQRAEADGAYYVFRNQTEVKKLRGLVLKASYSSQVIPFEVPRGDPAGANAGWPGGE
jgi:hypothetical protein